MAKRRALIAWTLGIAGAVLVAAALAAALLPRLADLESVRKRIVAEASRRTGGAVSVGRIDVALFPRPRATLRDAALTIPGTLRATAASLDIYPRIGPLLTGTLRIARIDARAPAVRAPLPAIPRKPAERPSLEQVESAVASALAGVGAKLPGLDVSVSAGRLDLDDGGRTVLSFTGVEGDVRLPPGALRLRLACRSNAFDRLAATASLEPGAFQGQARLEIARLRPRPLAAWLVPGDALPVPESAGDVAVVLRAGGIGVLDADVAGSAPSLELARGDRRRTVKELRYAGTLREERGTTTVSVRELSSASPKIALAGRLLLDPRAPRAEVDAAVRDADLSSLREAALALAGDVRDLREFFDVARAGRVPSAEVRIRARTPGELGRAGNIVASLRVADGRVFVPGPDLDLASAAGEISFAHGVLEGRGLSARLGRSRARDGRLTLGLAGTTRVFRLDAMVHADLSELPPLLSRLVGPGAFRDELSRISDVRGEADGRLLLGDTTAAVRPRFDVSDLRLSGRSGRVPFPVAISRGRVSYDGEVLSLGDMAGTLGASTASGVAARFALGKAPAIDALGGSFSLALGELYPWIASLVEGGEAIPGITGLAGRADVSVAQLAGPLAGPGRWRFAATGDVKDVVAVTPDVPRPVAIDRGSFRATTDGVSFTGVRGRLLDAALSASGTVGRPAEGGRDRAYDLSLDGRVGPDAAEWVSDRVGVPPPLRVKAPLSLSGARLSRTAAGRTAFSGTLAFPGGTAAAIALRKDGGELAIDNLAVRDEDSEAAIVLRIGPNAVFAGFSGVLAHETLDRVLAANAVRRGHLAGDFQAEIRRDRPEASSARGTVEGRDLVVPIPGENPVAVESVSLRADGSAVRIVRSAVRWLEQRLAIAGTVGFAAGGVRVDLDVAADNVAADAIVAGLRSIGRAGGPEKPAAGAGGEGAPPGDALYAAPVSGVLRLKAGLLRFGRYAWSPVDAAIALSPGEVTVTVADAAVCGIATPGTLSVTPRDLALDFTLSAADGRLARSLECLTGKRYGATGRFTFRAHVAGRGAPGAIARSLDGDFALDAVKGRIHRFNLLAKILAIVNVTEVFRGKFPDLEKEGFAYNAIKVQGTLKNGKVVLSDASLDGASLGMIAHGTADLTDRNVDMVALVAPLRTIDAIVRRIPVLGYILGGSLVSIPVAVKGDVDDPTITVLPPSQVAAGMLRILERILKAPVKLLER